MRLLGYMLVPGAGACFASRAALGRSHLTFLAMSFGMGFAVVALTSFTLVLARVFEPGSLVASWVGVSAVAWDARDPPRPDSAAMFGTGNSW